MVPNRRNVAVLDLENVGEVLINITLSNIEMVTVKNFFGIVGIYRFVNFMNLFGLWSDYALVLQELIEEAGIFSADTLVGIKLPFSPSNVVVIAIIKLNQMRMQVV